MTCIVSIIIPTYKPGEYLTSCLDSLCRQDADASAFEVIIVLNGPLQGYREQIETYISQHPEHQLRLLTTEVAGVSNARNVGLREAEGRFVGFIDDDDWVSQSYLRLLIEKAAGDDTIVCSNVKQIDDETHEEMSNYITDAYRRLLNSKSPSLFVGRSFLSSSCCKIIPRRAIGDARFDARFALGEDSLFMFAVSSHIRQITLASAECIYYIRASHSSASRSRMNYGRRLRNITLLCAAYTRTWLFHPSSYNLPLFLSRIVATLLKLFRRSY